MILRSGNELRVKVKSFLKIRKGEWVRRKWNGKKNYHRRKATAAKTLSLTNTSQNLYLQGQPNLNTKNQQPITLKITKTPKRRNEKESQKVKEKDYERKSQRKSKIEIKLTIIIMITSMLILILTNSKY